MWRSRCAFELRLLVTRTVATASLSVRPPPFRRIEWLESHPLYCLTNSTRRFRARPASVSLVATGAKEATPLASRRLALIL